MRRRSRYDEKKKMHRTKKEKKYSKMMGNQNVHITASPHSLPSSPSLLVFALRLVMSEFGLEFPHVLMRRFHVVSAEFVEDFFEVRNGLLRFSR